MRSVSMPVASGTLGMILSMKGASYAKMVALVTWLYRRPTVTTMAFESPSPCGTMQMMRLWL